jgi:hypothetical protein
MKRINKYRFTLIEKGIEKKRRGKERKLKLKLKLNRVRLS